MGSPNSKVKPTKQQLNHQDKQDLSNIPPDQCTEQEFMNNAHLQEKLQCQQNEGVGEESKESLKEVTHEIHVGQIYGPTQLESIDQPQLMATDLIIDHGNYKLIKEIVTEEVKTERQMADQKSYDELIAAMDQVNIHIDEPQFPEDSKDIFKMQKIEESSADLLELQRNPLEECKQHTQNALNILEEEVDQKDDQASSPEKHIKVSKKHKNKKKNKNKNKKIMAQEDIENSPIKIMIPAENWQGKDSKKIE